MDDINAQITNLQRDVEALKKQTHNGTDSLQIQQSDILGPVIQDIQTYTPAAGDTVILNLPTSNAHHITMPAGDITLSAPNNSPGQFFIVRILQDSVGGRSVTWFSTINWAGGTAPTLTATANKADTFGFETTGANTFDGFVIGQAI